MIQSLVLFLATQNADTSDVKFVLDEPRAALAILDKLQKGSRPTEADWKKLFATEGYRRLKERELGMKRPFADDDFKKFLAKPETVAKTEALSRSLSQMEKLDIGVSARRSLSYLPSGAKLRATIYPLIKPLKNSFVWDVEKNPAIMLYMDPAKSATEIQVTAAHELHHIGYSASCPSAEFKQWLARQDEKHQTAYYWLPALGEGFAVLCQTGGPSPNPYQSFDKETSDAWVEHYAKVKDSFPEVEQFFADVLNGKLDKEKAQEKAVSFYGMLGPWYTVGYFVATTIEDAFGKDRLIACYVDPRLILPTYNAAALILNLQDKGQRPLWSESLLAGMKG